MLGLVERQQDVGGLDVAVHQAAGVRGVERRAVLGPNEARRPRLGQSPRPRSSTLREVDPVDEPHHDVEQAVVQPAS